MAWFTNISNINQHRKVYFLCCNLWLLRKYGSMVSRWGFYWKWKRVICGFFTWEWDTLICLKEWETIAEESTDELWGTATENQGVLQPDSMTVEQVCMPACTWLLPSACLILGKYHLSLSRLLFLQNDS